MKRVYEGKEKEKEKAQGGWEYKLKLSACLPRRPAFYILPTRPSATAVDGQHD